MKFKRFVNPAHPGEILIEEFLKPMELSQLQFSKEIGWSSRKVSFRGANLMAIRHIWTRRLIKE